jgi:NADH-quinone oxidoreductase subunit H
MEHNRKIYEDYSFIGWCSLRNSAGAKISSKVFIKDDEYDYRTFVFMEILMRIILNIIIQIVVTRLRRLLRIRFFTIRERKIIASIQRRHGPVYVGWWGLLQAIADGVKLRRKEFIIPGRSQFILFCLAPLIVLSCIRCGWLFIPLRKNIVLLDFEYSIICILVLSALGAYGLIFAGWASGSRYAFLGGVRAVAQLVSYELILTGIIVLGSIIIGTGNIYEIKRIQVYGIEEWLVWPLLGRFRIRMVRRLAETNRIPFDLPEAEAELVAGYNVEYSALAFAFFFVGEYGNIILMAIFLTTIFIGGGLTSRIIRCVWFIVVRATLPRFRYDQLILLSWGKFLPYIMRMYGLCIGLLRTI